MSVPLLRPFPGLRPTSLTASQVAAPPYDVLSSDEAREMALGKPHSFLHVSKPEIDLPPGTDVYAPAVYAKAAENLKAMAAAGVLVRDAKPCFYVYRLKMGSHVQTGIVGGGSVAAYDANRIRKHEFTRPDKEDDRVRQIDACDAQTGPVLLAHRDTPELAAVIKAVTAAPPAYSVTAADGIVHTLWVMDNEAQIQTVTRSFDAMEAVYIADGHHRSAAASRVAAARRQGNADGACESFLVVTFPIHEMKIFDYNRVVKDLGGLTSQAFLKALDSEFTVEPSPEQARPAHSRQFGLYIEGRWYRLGIKNPPPADPVARLDVSLLSDRLLGPVLGIHDLRKDKRVDFVGGKRGLSELERRVDSGEMACAFALFPTQMEDLVAVADSNQVMPPKSTWFEPKLADGLVSYPLDWR
ncbi:hypothetical protein CCC_03293 [Paramagnetospirillum magnetotacticum MS-1]|uniref:DUF1015 domain-containing protein n=1 Tax=Paramagnetospirillum magnetotacticum MS-1 TaxID=272627 RepID=A0A0C2Z1B0_PARME|nr:DUF1015 family protein [Paramagnetospirillum magnetotacticum]KIM00691.1 hypothetical protein CCC_03293 [Paramagnetospirillum magnetotacticum MS-1]